MARENEVSNMFRDQSLFSGGGGGGGEGLLILGGGTLFFELKFGEGHFFSNWTFSPRVSTMCKKPFLKDFCPLRKLVRLFFMQTRRLLTL